MWCYDLNSNGEGVHTSDRRALETKSSMAKGVLSNGFQKKLDLSL
jgi:hypothetical protein